MGLTQDERRADGPAPAGPALLVVFLLNGLVTLLTAMVHAELGGAFRDAGGGCLWVKTSLPDPNGFLSGWMSLFAHAVACSLYALGFGAYFRLVVTAAGVPGLHWGFLGGLPRTGPPGRAVLLSVGTVTRCSCPSSSPMIVTSTLASAPPSRCQAFSR